MSIIQQAFARQATQPQGSMIDYVRMSRVRPSQKAALTRAVKMKDPERIATVCRDAVLEWDAIGAWPDDWSRWQRALDDALGWTRHIDLRDL